MQRRLIATIIGIVVGAILLSGVVTFALASHAARDRTRQELVTQARDFAAGYKADLQTGGRTPPDTTTAARLASLLQLFKGPLRDVGAAVVIVGPGGRLRDAVQATPVALPNGLTEADLQPDQLLAGHMVSGVKGPVVFAAAPLTIDAQIRRAGQVTTTPLVQAVILTRKPNTGLRAAAPWFLLAALIVVGVAAVVGDRLGRRISRPLLAAEAVTRRIAAGDLGAQLAPTHPYPELESLAESINTMAANLARSKGLERQFLMSVSHDLRTPLTSIRGFAEAIAEGAAPDNIRAAEVIAAEARRLERLVRDLLELAKLDARRFGLDMRRTDLSEVVADTGEGFRPAAEELGLQLRMEPGAAGAIEANVDPDRLAQALANLVENALKYAATEVRVGVQARGDHVVIWVDDDGPGIAPDDLPRVFDRLFMSTRHPARQVGSGLGLAIVSELVGAMGGTVTAQSPLTFTGPSGRAGTRMVVTLPMWARTTAPSSLSAV